MKYTKAQREEILSKQALLKDAQEVLKKEFVGIDNVIDEVINSIGSWFLFPDLQDKPVVVNLWGLTGTGKSSLVNRLVDLLNYESRYIRFDLGESGRARCIKDILEEIYENHNAAPMIIAFDEFQHARTINEMNREIINFDTRVIWELLDSGHFMMFNNSYHLDEINDLIGKLSHLLGKGVKTSKGKVLSHKISFIKEMDLEREYTDYKSDKMRLSNVKIVPADYYDKIYEIAKSRYNSPFEIREKLHTLNGTQTVRFLKEIVEYALYPKMIDCTKAMIFVMGNLDEAYTMSKNFNPDLDADEFHELSLKINVHDVKTALQRRLRNEQIARLGNTHIIYPAFNKESFKKLIEMDLERVENSLYEHQGIKIEFDESIKDIIYKEGVFPTQGTRPVFTTVHNIVKSKLAGMISCMIINEIRSDKIRVSYSNGFVRIDYLFNGELVHTHKEKQMLKLENIRSCKKDDMQTITAVHEAGHAVISTILLKTYPEVIVSTTVDNSGNGFIFTKFKWEYTSRKQILNRLAMFLGGYAAEKIVFGDDNVTIGADDDIGKATSFIMEMLKSSGMGSLPASYQVKDFRTNYALHDINNKINDEAEQWIRLALNLAEKTLKEQEVLLLKISDHLSDNRSLQKEEIREMVKKYVKNFDTDDMIENGDHLFYRKHLKSKVRKIEVEYEKEVINNACIGISLNKNS